MKHIASYALIGITGRRVGARFVFKYEDIPAAVDKPFFRWRNWECRRLYIEKLMEQKQNGPFGYIQNR